MENDFSCKWRFGWIQNHPRDSYYPSMDNKDKRKHNKIGRLFYRYMKLGKKERTKVRIFKQYVDEACCDNGTFGGNINGTGSEC